jgi:hypothetical protein
MTISFVSGCRNSQYDKRAQQDIHKPVEPQNYYYKCDRFYSSNGWVGKKLNPG